MRQSCAKRPRRETPFYPYPPDSTPVTSDLELLKLLDRALELRDLGVPLIDLGGLARLDVGGALLGIVGRRALLLELLQRLLREQEALLRLGDLGRRVDDTLCSCSPLESAPDIQGRGETKKQARTHLEQQEGAQLLADELANAALGQLVLALDDVERSAALDQDRERVGRGAERRGQLGRAREEVDCGSSHSSISTGSAMQARGATENARNAPCSFELRP